jgi:hypothetical protein
MGKTPMRKSTGGVKVGVGAAGAAHAARKALKHVKMIS